MPEVAVGDVTLAYAVTGPDDGEPVVLVCGTGQPAAYWHVFSVPALVAAGYRVVTFDNRGMAPSSCPEGPYAVSDLVADAAGLIEALGLGPALLAGYSLGAFVAQELALARPDLVRAVALMGTIGRQSAFTRALFGCWVDLDRAGVALPDTYRVVAALPSLFSPETLADDDRAAVLAQIGLPWPHWVGAGCAGQHAADVGYDGRLEALGGVQVPALVVVFAHDAITHGALGREVAAAIPGARLVEVDGCGHAGPFERPEAVNAALVEFFASC